MRRHLRFVSCSRGRAAALCACVLIAACSPTDDSSVLHVARRDLTHAYDACVPLGWAAVPDEGSFLRGVSVEAAPNGWWIPPLWRGLIYKKDLHRPGIRRIYDVLAHLAKAGLVQRIAIGDAYLYYLTDSGASYYAYRDRYGMNPGDESFLCYSRMRVDRVAWVGRVRDVPAPDGSIVRGFRAGVVWEAGPNAQWASDAYLRAHAVRLVPPGATATLLLGRIDGAWQVIAIQGAGPLSRSILDVAAWRR